MGVEFQDAPIEFTGKNVLRGVQIIGYNWRLQNNLNRVPWSCESEVAVPVPVVHDAAIPRGVSDQNLVKISQYSGEEANE